MNYFDKSLLSGERIVYRAGLHFMHWLRPLLALVASLALTLRALHAISTGGDGLWGWALLAGGITAICSVCALAAGLVRAVTGELAVTNKRVLIKIGFVFRRSVELNLGKVEGIGVEQSILGRILGYGTIVVTGTGGTPEGYVDVCHPLEFRRQVQERIGQAQVHALAPMLLAQQPDLQALLMQAVRK